MRSGLMGIRDMSWFEGKLHFLCIVWLTGAVMRWCRCMLALIQVIFSCLDMGEYFNQRHFISTRKSIIVDWLIAEEKKSNRHFTCK
jgi:hypothetical protein